jgi:hypothetical protein
VLWYYDFPVLKSAIGHRATLIGQRSSDNGQRFARAKQCKILNFLTTFPGKKLFFIYTLLQGNPLHIPLDLPIALT